jgi:hypothetical protein
MATWIYKPPAWAPLPAAPSNLYGFPTRPGITAENNLLRQIEALPSLYNPVRRASKAALSEALKPYGDMFTFAADDPSTPIDESLGVTYNEKAVPGPAYRDAVRRVKSRHASRGTLYSSYADRDLGAEASRISAHAKEIVQKYAAGMDDLARNEAATRNDLIEKLATLYGEDAKWIADQAPPAPPPAAPKKLANHGSRPDGLFTWKEWVANRRAAGFKDKDLTPERFWSYIAKWGGTR